MKILKDVLRRNRAAILAVLAMTAINAAIFLLYDVWAEPMIYAAVLAFLLLAALLGADFLREKKRSAERARTFAAIALARHSLNTCKAALAVFEAMKTVEPGLEQEVKHDSIILASLLHDVCKCDIYKRSVKKRKNALGIWEDAEGYKITYKSFPMGHGEKSLALLLCSGLPLNDDEMLAIRWHMGAWGVNQNSYEDVRNYDAARKLYPLVTIIQTADGLAASIMERTGEEIDEL